MKTDLSVLSNTNLAKNPAYDLMMEETDRVASGGFESRRISIRGARFREMVGGDQMRVNSSGSMNVVIVRVSEVGRTYYEGAYDPNAEKAAAPVCWSADSTKPAKEVKHPKAKSCDVCPMNIKGSGQGDSRACRYSVRAAVCLEGDFETVYQMSIPATSYFGKSDGQDHPLQSYVKLLKTNNFALPTVVTQMYFDEDSETPKLFFKPVRSLDDEEFEQITEAFNSEEAKRAITLTVYQADSEEFEIDDADEEEEPAPKPRAKPKAKAKVVVEEPADEVDEEEVDETDEEEVAPPVKRARVSPEKASTLTQTLAGWD